MIFCAFRIPGCFALGVQSKGVKSVGHSQRGNFTVLRLTLSLQREWMGLYVKRTLPELLDGTWTVMFYIDTLCRSLTGPPECRPEAVDGFPMESPWKAGPCPLSTPFPQETAASARPSGPQLLPFGWKAAAHLSTGLDSVAGILTQTSHHHRHLE